MKAAPHLDEARAFLEAVSEHRLYALNAAFHLCLVTGMRRGEILALRWSDVDVDTSAWPWSSSSPWSGARPVLKQLKTQSSDRLVTFGASTARVLSTHQRRQDEEQAFVGWRGSTRGCSSPHRSAAGSTPTTSVGSWTR